MAGQGKQEPHLTRSCYAKGLGYLVNEAVVPGKPIPTSETSNHKRTRLFGGERRRQLGACVVPNWNVPCQFKVD
jgi:hypothetical protein